MKVVLLAPTPPPRGGIAGWTERMLKVNLKNGWKVSVVDEKTINRKDAYAVTSNYCDEVKRCLRIWRDLKRELRDEEARVVQACIPARVTSMLREYISAVIAKKKNRFFIAHFRCTVPNMVKSRLSHKVFCAFLKRCDAVFVLNNASADFVKKYSPNTKYFIIPNFIELTNIYEKKVINNEIKKLVYVGGVNEEKGCGVIADVAKSFPDKEFRLIGHVDMNTSSFPRNVVLLGEQPKTVVQEELRNADVFLFLTRYSGEGFSNALAEAMAFSLPCIVSDWAANADMIENKGGTVIKKNDSQSVRDSINQLEDRATREIMGNWSRNKVLNAYSDSIVTGIYVDAYEEIISLEKM